MNSTVFKRRVPQKVDQTMDTNAHLKAEGNQSFYQLDKSGEEAFNIRLGVTCTSLLNVSSDYVVLLCRDNSELPHVDMETQREWLQWLTQESSYASCFLQNDIDDGMSRGFLVDGSSNRALVYGAASCFRRLHEWQYQVNLWYALVKHGCDKNLAHILSSLFKGNYPCRGSIGKGHVISLGYFLSHSDFSDGGTSVKQVSGFVKGKQKKGVSFKARPVCGSTTVSWGDDGGRGFYWELRDLLSNYTKAPKYKWGGNRMEVRLKLWSLIKMLPEINKLVGLEDA